MKMKSQASLQSRIVLVLLCTIILSFLMAGAARSVHFDTPFPEEPERYDSEYYLDMLTMRIDRDWRDLIDGRDNLFLLRFGSLNVEQWCLIESLKFSSDISRRFRIWYWMDLNYTLDERSSTRNEIEVEFNIHRKYYISLFLAPSSWKRENDIGLVVQRRTAVDKYVKIAFKVHDFANNFACEHGDNIEGEKNLFIRQPFELILEGREQAGRSLRFGIRGLLTNRWQKEYRFLEGGGDYDEEGYVRDLSLWIEKDMPGGVVFNLDIRTAEYFLERTETGAAREMHNVREFLPRLWWHPAGRDFSVSTGLQVRRERWTGEGAEDGGFRKNELLPFILLQKRFSEVHMLEFGYLADRFDSERTGTGAGSSDRWENRLKICWEARFRGTSRFRLIETIDLDREDWGDYSVHDHFFLMLVVGF